MFEKIKELGFTICAISLGISNLATFLIIAIYNKAYIWEPMKWVLYLEAFLCLVFIIWSFERLYRDCAKMKEESEGDEDMEGLIR